MSSPRSASATAPQPALLVRQFDAFYSLLQSLADRLRPGHIDADKARTELVVFFVKQENALRPLGAGFLHGVAAPARRAMAVMVDQLLGEDLDWSGRAAWAADPLAPRLFNQTSGTEIAAQVRRDVDDLLKTKEISKSQPSKAQEALARVYLEALGLGLSQPFEPEEIEELEHGLFTFLYPQAPPPGQPQLLFPEAYAHTATGGDRALLPTAKPWWRILAISGLLLLLISWPIWRDATELVRAALAKMPPSEITGGAR